MISWSLTWLNLFVFRHHMPICTLILNWQLNKCNFVDYFRKYRCGRRCGCTSCFPLKALRWCLIKNVSYAYWFRWYLFFMYLLKTILYCILGGPALLIFRSIVFSSQSSNFDLNQRPPHWQWVFQYSRSSLYFCLRLL